MISAEDWDRFCVLRGDLFDAIAGQLAIDGHCKSYEGQFSIGFPHYFHARCGERDGWSIGLDCYVIGPSRHYDWTGETFAEALDAAEADIRQWIADAVVDDDDA